MVRANVTTAGFCSRCCGGLLKEEGQNHVKPVKCNFSFGMSATKARCQLAAILSSIWIFSENARNPKNIMKMFHLLMDTIPETILLALLLCFCDATVLTSPMYRT